MSILNDPDYCWIISDFWQTWRDERQRFASPLAWWDVGKTYIHDLTVNFRQAKSKSRILRHKQLQRRIKTFQRLVAKGQRDAEAVCSLRCCKEELRQLDLVSLNGNRIRSRIQWLKEGEKTSRFLLSQERRRGRKSSIMELQDNDGVAHKTLSAMLDVAATCYDHLFRADATTPECEKFFSTH